MRRALVIIAIVLVPNLAHAFPIGAQFDLDPVTSDGAGGVAFTGAPRWTSHDCSACHTDPPHRIQLRVEADPVDLFHAYVPGEQYRMRVVMVNEHAAADFASAGDDCQPNVDQRCDDNGFALEIDDAMAQPQGQFITTAADGTCGNAEGDSESHVMKGGQVVTHNGVHHGLTSWTFCWTAPDAGTGPVTIYVAAVDGNGGDGTRDLPNDTAGDDVVVGAIPLLEEGGTPPPQQTGGCAIGGRGVIGGGTMVIVALAIVLAARRRRGRGIMVALFAMLISAGGCVTVHPWQKEQLADRKMQFGADPDEAELDLHMQEAREGSAGGYGSAGGGCGCN